MKKLKYKIEYITSKEIKDVNYLKQSVFNGNIFFVLEIFQVVKN